MSQTLTAAAHTALTAPRALYRILRRRPWLAVLLIFILLAAIGAFTPLSAVAAPENGDGYAPAGFGDLLKGPDTPANGRTLYESYPLTAFYFDTSRLGAQDQVLIIINTIAGVVMFLAAAIIRGAIVLAWQMFDFSNWDTLTAAITPAIGRIATELLGWLLPTALAVGAVVAYGQHKAGSGLGQILWVFAGGLLALSFSISPNTWVDTLTSVRTASVGSIVGATSSELQVTQTPFVHVGDVYDENDPNSTMMRKAGDAMWRTFVVTPWCIAEFGSQEACSAFGKGLLEAGTAAEDRTTWIQANEEGHPGYFDDSAAGYKWVAGKNAPDRLGIAVIALVVAAVFGVLIMCLSFAANLAWVSVIFLLVVGVFFAVLSCIPGKPRSWTMRWIEAIIGATVQSILGALVLSATLILTTAAFAISGDQGWAVGAGMALTIAFAGFALRRTLATIMTAMTPGMGMSSLIGAMAIRGGARIAGKAGRATAGAAWSGTKAAGNSLGRGATKAGGALRRGAGGAYKRGIGERLGFATTPNKYRRAAPPQPREPLQITAGSSSQQRPGLPAGNSGPPQIENPRRSGTANVGGKKVATTPHYPPGHGGRTVRTGSPAPRPSDSFGPARGPRVIEVGPDGRVSTVRTRGVGSPHLRDNPPRPRRQNRPAAPTVPRPAEAPAAARSSAANPQPKTLPGRAPRPTKPNRPRMGAAGPRPSRDNDQLRKDERS